MERKGETAIEWGIKNYWLERTDEQLAHGLNTDVATIKKTREELGLIRPVGTKTMKEAAREYLLEMSPMEKRAFLKSLDPEKVWEMGEGKAATVGELKVSTEPVRIDITHQLLKVYGPALGKIIDHVSGEGEGSRLSGGPGE